MSDDLLAAGELESDEETEEIKEKEEKKKPKYQRGRSRSRSRNPSGSKKEGSDEKKTEKKKKGKNRNKSRKRVPRHLETMVSRSLAVIKSAGDVEKIKDAVQRETKIDANTSAEKKKVIAVIRRDTVSYSTARSMHAEMGANSEMKRFFDATPGICMNALAFQKSWRGLTSKSDSELMKRMELDLYNIVTGGKSVVGQPFMSIDEFKTAIRDRFPIVVHYKLTPGDSKTYERWVDEFRKEVPHKHPEKKIVLISNIPLNRRSRRFTNRVCQYIHGIHQTKSLVLRDRRLLRVYTFFFNINVDETIGNMSRVLAKHRSTLKEEYEKTPKEYKEETERRKQNVFQN